VYDNQGHKVWFEGSFSLTTFMQLEFKKYLVHNFKTMMSFH